MNDVKYNQPTPAPTAKVAAVGVSGAVLTVLTIIGALFHITLPQSLTDNVGELVTGIVALTSIIHFVAGYFTKDKKPAEAVEVILEGKKPYER